MHDLPVDDALVRLWDVEGGINGDMIRSAFRPLMATGFVWPYVALMPDYHPGEGSMIGSVIPTRQVVLPSVIGGDVGCGITAVRLPIQTEQVARELPTIETRIRASIPVGTAHNGVVTDRVQQNPVWQRDARAPILPTACAAKCCGSLHRSAAAITFWKSSKTKKSTYGACFIRDHGISVLPFGITTWNGANSRKGSIRSSLQEIPYLQAGNSGRGTTSPSCNSLWTSHAKAAAR